jgi:hypothetical protein
MTVTITLNGTMTLDESAGLQNATVPPSVPGDANDNDVSLSRLQSQVSAFYNRLYWNRDGPTWPPHDVPSGGRIAESPDNFIQIAHPSEPGAQRSVGSSRLHVCKRGQFARG